MVPKDLLDRRLPQTFNLKKKKKKKKEKRKKKRKKRKKKEKNTINLQSIIKQSAIKRGMPSET